jgi:hypothetical protein
MQCHRYDERRPQNPHRWRNIYTMRMVPCMRKNKLHTYIQNNAEDPEGTEICTDKKVNQLFHQTGCLSCQSKNGIVKMFPDKHEVRLLGRQGHWWIYFECTCEYQTAGWKVKQKLKTIKRRGYS